MNASVYIINAFTEALFGGNPAAVVPVELAMSDQLMQSIAAQHNLSETAFPECLGPDRFNLRWSAGGLTDHDRRFCDRG